MKHLYFFGLLFSLPFLGFSQKEFNNWYFGQKAAVTFISGFPLPFGSSQLISVGTSTSVSDSLAQILFYTEGSSVYNRNNDVMPNGWINGVQCSHDFAQLSLAIKQINSNQYYLISTDAGCVGSAGYWALRYSIIDMALDGGNGDIPNALNGVYIEGGYSAFNSITGTRHHNNRDAWAVTRLQNQDSNYYAAYLVDPAGLHVMPVFSNSRVHLLYFSSNYFISNMRISKDGAKLVANYNDTCEFCLFDDVTGHVNSLFTFRLPLQGSAHMLPRSAEFSLDSKLLYISGETGTPTNHGYIYQYDATKTDSAQFVQSAVLVGTNSFRAPALQMAPDWKIYTSNPNIDSIGVISNPSVQGMGCNYQRNIICLGPGKRSGGGFPQFVERYYAVIHPSGFCPGRTIAFSAEIWPPADSIHWDFGDPGSGLSNYSLLPNPSHTYPGTGQYTAELFTRHIDKRTDTTWKVVNILLNPDVGPDRTICNGDSATFDAGTCPGATYAWKDLGSGIVVGNSRLFKTGLAGTYEVTITNPDKCDAKDTVQLMTTPVPDVTNNPPFKSICSGESTNISLTTSVTGTNFHWTATLTSGNITGFSADSGLVINQILTNTLPTPGIVVYHITPKIGNCTGNTVDFQVTVNQGDSVKVSITSSTNNICEGTPVTFTAFPTFPGANPVYQWKVNGINSGTNSSSYNYIPLNGDIVTCVLTSSNVVCTYNNPATSNPVAMVVNPVLTVKDSIAASQNPVCAGSMITFTSYPTNGGNTPSYQWKVNGINAGTNSATFSYIPVNNDQVYCILTSSEPCTSSNPASSIIITMTVNTNLPATVSIAPSSNPFCPGSSVTFNALPTNGGAPSYQWKVNGINVGINSNTYTYNPVNGDSVRCIMTSTLACITGNPVSSNKIIMNGSLAPIVTFTSCFDTITTINAKPIKLKGGIPLGGTYSGPGVNSLTGIYTPSIAGPGTHTITYSYTNAELCSANASVTIITIVTPVTMCGNPLTDVRDNRVYQTLQIGTQCWIATNLNFGTTIASTQDQRDNCINEKYCYNDNPVNCTSNGGLYQWDEVMKFDDTPAGQGFCPPGWHIPTENEWDTLFTNWTNSGFAGSPLKYSGYSGFNALMSGARHINKGWDFQGFATFFWSSTLRSDNKAWAHGMNDADPSVSVYPASRVNAFSVRCLKD